MLDLGSSRLKWQLRSAAGVVLDEGRQGWDRLKTAPALPRGKPIAVWMVRVGALEREEDLRTAIRAAYGAVPVVSVRPQALGPLGLQLDYDLGQFGADRYCALLGVLSRSRRPAVVVDAGTAVTVDLLGADGLHRGGYILPGLRVGLAAVNRLFDPELQAQVAYTLNLEEGVTPHERLLQPGHDTGKALLHGWMSGLAAAIERLGEQAADGENPEWWLTGGDAARLSMLLRRPAQQISGLVFDGLWCHLHPDPGKGGDTP